MRCVVCLRGLEGEYRLSGGDRLGELPGYYRVYLYCTFTDVSGPRVKHSPSHWGLTRFTASLLLLFPIIVQKA